MMRVFGFLMLVGIGLICAGAYEFFIQAGASRKPTTISLAELERSVPSNRHLILTGGRPMLEDALVYFKTRRGGKVAGSEVYFIPMQDTRLAAYRSLTPPVLLRINEPEMAAIKAGKGFQVYAIQGVRMPHWELENKAEELLVKQYGKPAVDRMVVLQYRKEVTGLGASLQRMGLGALLLVGTAFLGALKGDGR